MTEAVDDRQQHPDSRRQRRQSLHERVMTDPESRYAYFNTTQGTLRADPSHRDMQKILKVLEDNEIVYLYEADTSRPRPVFFSRGHISIGLAEIAEAAGRLTATP
ncbi:MAG: hypothetical protein OXL98_08670 [Acidimicrobiaceae bacterium]|nr:hypothetical protein [Acidimicrobiaceae bacterium]